MHNHHVHVAGLQETRSKIEGYQSHDKYHILSAPATQAGQGGTQLQLCVNRQWGKKEN